MRDFFMKTQRIGFSKWESSDLGFALQLWGDNEVTKYICAAGVLSKADRLFVGHRPQNESSKKLLIKLGFRYIGDNYYHPSYEL